MLYQRHPSFLQPAPKTREKTLKTLIKTLKYSQKLSGSGLFRKKPLKRRQKPPRLGKISKKGPKKTQKPPKSPMLGPHQKNGQKKSQKVTKSHKKSQKVTKSNVQLPRILFPSRISSVPRSPPVFGLSTINYQLSTRWRGQWSFFQKKAKIDSIKLHKTPKNSTPRAEARFFSRFPRLSPPLRPLRPLREPSAFFPEKRQKFSKSLKNSHARVFFEKNPKTPPKTAFFGKISKNWPKIGQNWPRSDRLEKKHEILTKSDKK